VAIPPFWGFIAAAGAVGFCFGGFLALYPAICADYFGAKNISANYGALFAAYGAGGLFGPWLAAGLSQTKIIEHQLETTSYANPLFAVAALCLAASFAIFHFLKPEPRR